VTKKEKKYPYRVRISDDITAEYYGWGVVVTDKGKEQVYMTQNELARLVIGTDESYQWANSFESRTFRPRRIKVNK
jgi:hypothetical protein